VAAYTFCHMHDQEVMKAICGSTETTELVHHYSNDTLCIVAAKSRRSGFLYHFTHLPGFSLQQKHELEQFNFNR
jgi:hypothetical protein